MLRAEGLTVRFGSFTALDAVDLDVADGEIVSVLGPSGSGKSTLLRVVAGLVPEAHGRVGWDGTDVTAMPPHRRGFGLMFQDHALFPHRDVLGNVAFGLRMRGDGRAETTARAEAALERVGLAGFEHRNVADLSGGEQQRVALARALAPEPRLLMLDEPLGALDRALRDRLVCELRALFTELALSVVFVTHDHDEAFALADRVVVMHDGRVVQSGTPAAVWSAPADAFVASFLGWNVSRAFGDGMLALRPDDLILDRGPASEPHSLAARVTGRAFRRDHHLVTVRVDGVEPTDELRVAVPADQQPPEIGDQVTVSARPGAGVALPP
jgi:thiamine transport system ATP-binding protein